jgi:hypothetical protein
MTEFEREKLDKMLNRLDEALVRLTMMEERLAQNGRSLERAFNTIDELKTKTQTLETAHAVSQSKIGMNERVVWLIISAIVGVVTYSFKV